MSVLEAENLSFFQKKKIANINRRKNYAIPTAQRRSVLPAVPVALMAIVVVILGMVH